MDIANWFIIGITDIFTSCMLLIIMKQPLFYKNNRGEQFQLLDIFASAQIKNHGPSGHVSCNIDDVDLQD